MLIKKNYVLSILTILFSVFFLYEMTQINLAGSSFIISATWWPQVMLVGMLVLGIVMLIRSVYQSKKESVVSESETEATNINEETGEESARVSTKYLNLQMSFISMIVLGIYLFLMSRIGFILATMLFVSVMASFLGIKNKWRALLLAAVSTAVIVIVFPHLLAIPLPRGVGFFLRFSQMFY